MNKQHYSLQHTEASIREEYQKAMQEALDDRKDALRLQDSDYFAQIIDISKGRTSTKELFVEMSKHFFVHPEYDLQKCSKEHSVVATHFLQAFAKVAPWKAEELKSVLNTANHLAAFASVAKALRYIMCCSINWSSSDASIASIGKRPCFITPPGLFNLHVPSK